MAAHGIKLSGSGVYQIRNLVNGNKYIGSACRISNRFYSHRCDLKYNRHSNNHLQAAYNKYGVDEFAFEVIEQCEKLMLSEREQFHLDAANKNQLYNILPRAYTPQGRKMPESFCQDRRNYRHTDEAKKRIGAYWKHRRRGPMSVETRKKISDAKRGSIAWNKKLKPIIVCMHCQMAFAVRPYKAKLSRTKFCSRKCHNDHRKRN